MAVLKRSDVDEFYRRLAEVNPDPNTELDYKNEFTLLVAVVLSAQATDVGVNKATEPLFKTVDSPEKMVAFGETKLRRQIKTIGLYRNKAKNVIGLSRMLITEHGGRVPADRAALEALPGVGRKTANVVLNVAFGEPTIAVDTHIFRVSNRSGLAPGVQRRHRRTQARVPHPRSLEATRPPLADPARPPCVQGPQARMLALCRERPLPLQGEDRGLTQTDSRPRGGLNPWFVWHDWTRACRSKTFAPTNAEPRARAS